MRERVAAPVPPSDERAVEVLVRADLGRSSRDHVRPDLVHVDAVGVIHHIGRAAARRAHIHLERDDLPFLAEVTVAVEAEKFKMDEAALYAERRDGSPAFAAHFLGQRLADVKDAVLLFVDDVHQRARRHVARFENGLSRRVDDRIVRTDGAVDILFHDITFISRRKEGFEIFLALDGEGGVRAHAVIGLDDGAPHFLQKVAADEVIFGGAVARDGDARRTVALLHAGFEFDGRHLGGMKAACDVEVVAQAGVPFQPILVVALQPVGLAVFEGEVGDGAVHLVVVFERGDVIIFVEGEAQLLTKAVVGAVPHAQNADAAFAQGGAEPPIVLRKIGREKDKILHAFLRKRTLLAETLYPLRHRLSNNATIFAENSPLCLTLYEKSLIIS